MRGGRREMPLAMLAARFLHLATNRRVLVSPTPIEAASAFVDSLLAIPGVEMWGLGRKRPLLKELSISPWLAANDITDAGIAAGVRAWNPPCDLRQGVHQASRSERSCDPLPRQRAAASDVRDTCSRARPVRASVAHRVLGSRAAPPFGTLRKSFRINKLALSAALKAAPVADWLCSLFNRLRPLNVPRLVPRRS